MHDEVAGEIERARIRFRGISPRAYEHPVGHEIGHVLSGHALYRTMLLRLLRLMQGMAWLPVGYRGLRAIVAALQE